MEFAKRLFAALLGGVLTVASLAPVGAAADAAVPGTPYDAGGYNAAVPHVLVNQVFGASADAEVVSHSFIELYNPTASAVSLDGWQIACKSSPDGGDEAWQTFALSGTVAAKGHFLIRCGAVDEVAPGAWLVPAGDLEWDIQLHNKGVSVVLTSEAADLNADAGFAGAITASNRPAGYVDALAVQGNDGKTEQIPPVWEGSYEDFQSKKKAVCRENFADTDDNAADASDVDYSEVTPADVPVQNAVGETIAAQSSYTVKNDSYEPSAPLTLEKRGGVTLGTANADGGVAEIVAYDSVGGRAYVVNGQDSILNVFAVNEDGSFGSVEEIDVRALMLEADDSFTYGDMTSVAVSADGTVAVALQDEDYTKAGRVAVFGANNAIETVYVTGVQPDMVTFTADGRYILTADEGEPRHGYGADAVDPAGSVTVIDTQAAENAAKVAGFAAFDSAQLAAHGVIFNKIGGQILSAEADLEPEYIAVSGSKAYVSLQEANAVAVVDIPSASVERVLPLGFKDLSLAENAIDLDDSDGAYVPKTYENAYGVYMPDGVAVYTVGGKTYLATANEGDAREWGDKDLGQEEFTDEDKRDLTAADGSVAEKVRVLDNSVKAGLDEEGSYLYGARSFSLFEVTENGLVLAYDSANDFEARTWQYLPDYYNVSNDDIEQESRTAKKGTEPEAVALCALGGRTYAFIALERIGGIMVYDVTDPADVSYVNYVNTRDFNATTAGDVAPEGLAFAQMGETVYLLAAFEVSGTVASYRLTAEEAQQPGPGEGEENPGADEENPGPDDGPQGGSGNGTDGNGAANEGGCGSNAAAGSAGAALACLAGATVCILFVRRFSRTR